MEISEIIVVHNKNDKNNENEKISSSRSAICWPCNHSSGNVILTKGRTVAHTSRWDTNMWPWGHYIWSLELSLALSPAWLPSPPWSEKPSCFEEHQPRTEPSETAIPSTWKIGNKSIILKSCSIDRQLYWEEKINNYPKS